MHIIRYAMYIYKFNIFIEIIRKINFFIFFDQY